MKKTILLSFAVITANFAISQSVHYGIKGGLNLSNLTYKNAGSLDYKVGFHVGALAHIHVSRHFAVQPELMYSNQGGEGTLIGNNTNFKDHLNYINLPVLGQYMFGRGFRLETGPQLGFLTGAKRKINSNETNIKGNFKSTDFSWAFGIGYVGPQRIGFDARWLVGLNDINKLIGNNVATYNNNFQVGLFYQFDPGHGHARYNR
jgi:hypothetical protein